MQIDVPSAMTDDELETVRRILDQLGASPPDGDGYRHFSMSNGTRGRIGGFIEDPEVAGAGVRSLPMELSVENEFSTTEAALVLRIAAAANLFVGKPDDPTVVATTYAVTDRPFRKEHPRATVTPDEKSLVEWIRQNIPPLTSLTRADVSYSSSSSFFCCSSRFLISIHSSRRFRSIGLRCAGGALRVAAPSCAQFASVVVRIAARLAPPAGIVVRIEAAARRLRAFSLSCPILAESGRTLMTRRLGDRQVAEVELAQLLRADVAAVDAGLQLPLPHRVAALVDTGATGALAVVGTGRRRAARIAVFRVAHARPIVCLDRRARNRPRGEIAERVSRPQTQKLVMSSVYLP